MIKKVLGVIGTIIVGLLTIPFVLIGSIVIGLIWGIEWYVEMVGTTLKGE